MLSPGSVGADNGTHGQHQRAKADQCRPTAAKQGAGRARRQVTRTSMQVRDLESQSTEWILTTSPLLLVCARARAFSILFSVTARKNCAMRRNGAPDSVCLSSATVCCGTSCLIVSCTVSCFVVTESNKEKVQRSKSGRCDADLLLRSAGS